MLFGYSHPLFNLEILQRLIKEQIGLFNDCSKMLCTISSYRFVLSSEASGRIFLWQTWHWTIWTFRFLLTVLDSSFTADISFKKYVNNYLRTSLRLLINGTITTKRSETTTPVTWTYSLKVVVLKNSVYDDDDLLTDASFWRRGHLIHLVRKTSLLIPSSTLTNTSYKQCRKWRKPGALKMAALSELSWLYRYGECFI